MNPDHHDAADEAGDLRGAFEDLLSPLGPPRGLQPEGLRRGVRRRRAKMGVLGGTAALAIASVGVVAATGLPGSRGSTDQLMGSAGPGSTAPARTASASPTSSAVDPGPSPSAGPDSAPPAESSATPTPKARGTTTVILEGDGLGYLSGPSSIRHESFIDTSPAIIEQVMISALGGQPTRTPVPDCGQGVVALTYRLPTEVLSVYVNQTHFLGWALNPGKNTSAGRHLADGIGTRLGTTLADLRSNYSSLSVTSGTIGPEWSVGGGLAGGLTGTKGSSTVNWIHAGSACIAR